MDVVAHLAVPAALSCFIYMTRHTFVVMVVPACAFLALLAAFLRVDYRTRLTSQMRVTLNPRLNLVHHELLGIEFRKQHFCGLSRSMRLQVYVDALFGQVDVVQRLVPIAQLFQQRLFLSTVSCCLHDDCYDTLQILHVHVNPLQKKIGGSKFQKPEPLFAGSVLTVLYRVTIV